MQGMVGSQREKPTYHGAQRVEAQRRSRVPRRVACNSSGRRRRCRGAEDTMMDEWGMEMGKRWFDAPGEVKRCET